jgi:hypothetical protein
MLKAKRFDASGQGLSRELTKALLILWTIEGEPGLWVYKVGCKADKYVPVGCVIAESNGAIALFERAVKLEEMLSSHIGGAG